MISLVLTAMLVVATASTGPASTAPLMAQLDSSNAAPGSSRVIYVAEPERNLSHRWLFLGGGVLVITGIYLAIRSKQAAPTPSESETHDDQ